MWPQGFVFKKNIMTSEVADCINLRNRNSTIFLMSTDIGRMLDHISIALVQQVGGFGECFLAFRADMEWVGHGSLSLSVDS